MKFWKHYGLLLVMLLAMAAGCVVGAVWPGATALKPLGTIFINLMFCLVVPMVFASIAGAVANMRSAHRAGKIVGISMAVFFVTCMVASLIAYGLMLLFPPVQTAWEEIAGGEMGEYASVSQMIVNFFTADDFVGLLSRRAMLPLIVFSILFGFAVNINGGRESLMGKWLSDLSAVMMRFVKIITWYAPVAFFGFFADLVASYGPQITADYGRAMLVYYPLSFVYLLVAFPLLALIGGGKAGPKRLFAHIVKPTLVSLGTCSSVATIPTNLEAAKQTGISGEVADIVLPMGATMHMDGSGMACVLKVFFLFGVFGREMTPDMLFPVALAATLSAMGTSGVPGGGYIGEYIICTVFFPDQMAMAFPILVTIGNLLDPPATMVNAVGDYAACYVVERFVSGKDWLRKRLQP